MIAHALGALNHSAAAHLGTALGRVARVDDDQTRVVNPAIRIFEAFRELAVLERATERIGIEAQGARSAQSFSAADMVVEREPEMQHPGGPQSGTVRQHEAQRANDIKIAVGVVLPVWFLRVCDSGLR